MCKSFALNDFIVDNNTSSKGEVAYFYDRALSSIFNRQLVRRRPTDIVYCPHKPQEYKSISERTVALLNGDYIIY